MKPIYYPGKGGNSDRGKRSGCTKAGHPINIHFDAAGTLSHDNNNAFQYPLPQGYFGKGSLLVSAFPVEGQCITLTFDSGSGAQTVVLHIESSCKKPDEPID